MSALRLALACATIAGLAGPAAALPSGQDWLDHVTDDLLPFWSVPDALGSPVGAFPGRRCNDGTLPAASGACVGAGGSTRSDPERTLVAQSRQIYSYAVAFQMTGDPQWLALAEAGTQDLFETYADPTTGLLFERYESTTGVASNQGGFDPQSQGYGLLGPTMLYHVTGDAALYARIRAVDAQIVDRFAVGGGAYAASAGGSEASSRLVDQLDVLNTYVALMARAAPEADRGDYVARGAAIARHMRDAFWAEDRGLFATDAEAPEAEVDFGHSAKALWFIAMSAARAGDAELEAWAKSKVRALVDQALVEPEGAWATGTDDADGSTWWVHAELDQLVASMSLIDPELIAPLSRTADWWLESFVDESSGGTWSYVDIATGAPSGAQTKHWQWKAGFHAFEHALVMGAVAQAQEGGTANLWFAREPGEAVGGLYLLDGDLLSVEDFAVDGYDLQLATFGDVGFGAPVPAPPAGLLLAGGLAALVWRGQRRFSKNSSA